MRKQLELIENDPRRELSPERKEELRKAAEERAIEEGKARVRAAIDNMARDPDVIAIVQSIERGIKTTKGHYGRYMAVLTPFAKDRMSLFVMSRAMIRIGADPFGVRSAIKILTGAEW